MELASIVNRIRVLKMVVWYVELTNVIQMKSQLQMDDANAVRVARHEVANIPVTLFHVDQARY